MNISRCAIVILLVYSHSLSAQTLDESGCAFIEAFNLNNETSFTENFVFMNHNAEECIGGTNCYRPIRKRTQPVSLTIGAFLPSDPRVVEVAFLSIGNIRNWFSYLSGLEVELVNVNATPQLGAGFIRVEIVDDLNALKILETKTSQAKSEFSDFILDDRVKCLALNGDWANAGLEYSEVWIKADQPYGDISQCLTEEIYHTFGTISDPIGLLSLYSDPEFLPEQTGEPNFIYPPNRDVLIMQVLYDEMIINGDDIETTERKVEAIIQRDCGSDGLK